MNRTEVRKHLLFVFILLIIEILAGCSKSSRLTDDSAVPDGSKLDELQYYILGDPPKDLLQINNRINDLTKKELNLIVKFNFIAWSDYAQKYNLLISTGQPIDLIYTANWLGYYQLAKKNAFKELDKLLPEYAPELYEFVPDEYWNQVKVGGKIYTIPGTWNEYINNGFIYRQDLQEKFGLPVPNTLENVEKYFIGVKNNLPGQVMTWDYGHPGPTDWSYSAFEILAMKYSWVHIGTPYGLVADYDNPSDIRPYWGTEEFTEDMKMFKRWADEGFWSRGAIATKADATAFTTGKCIALIAGNNPNKYFSAVKEVQSKNPDWKVGYIPYPMVNGVAYKAHATQNGYAIPHSSQNPEKSLMFYQKLVLDKRYNQLTQYGIEGTHFTVDKDNNYMAVGDPTASGMKREGMNGWAWRNPNYMLYEKGFNIINNMFKDLDKIAEKSKYKGTDIFDGFPEDFTSYQNERAALGTVMTQYLIPLEAGLVPDVDSAVNLFMEKAKEASLDKIQSEYIRLWKAYCTSNNYN